MIKNHYPRLFNVLTVIILCGLCLLLNALTKINFHRLSLPKDKPEFAATGFQANLYAPNGSLLYQFNAESGKQFPNDNKIIMKNITIQAFNESTGEIKQQVTSNDGWLDPRLRKGFLGESIQLVITSKDPKQNIYVYTNTVNLDGESKTMDSSSPIRAIQGKSVLTGVGFTANYDKQQLMIKSKVEITYVK